jgi:hypothetical protein
MHRHLHEQVLVARLGHPPGQAQALRRQSPVLLHTSHWEPQPQIVYRNEWPDNLFHD